MENLADRIALIRTEIACSVKNWTTSLLLESS